MPGEHVVHTEETAEGLHVHGDDESTAAGPAGSGTVGTAGSETTGAAGSGTEQEPLD
jgi:hypothetical protein